MTAALHLAEPADLDRLLPMVAAFHATHGIDLTADQRLGAIEPLLEGSPNGVIYLIGPRKSPVGYIAIAFGWSIAFGGLDAFIDEFFIRDGVRGRGMGSEVLASLLPRLEAAGVTATHLEAHHANPRILELYRRHGFELRADYHLMTRIGSSGSSPS